MYPLIHFRQRTGMYWIVIAVLALAAYAALKLHALGKAQFVVAEFLEAQFKDLREATKKENL
jgi:hypothetical protein